MEKKHVCDICNYATDKLFNYKKHCKSKKHLSNLNAHSETPRDSLKTPKKCLNKQDEIEIESDNNSIIDGDAVNTCQYCYKVFSKACNRSRHEKICTEKKKEFFNYELKIKELETIIKNKDEIIKAKDEIILSKEKEIEFLKDNITENRKQSDKLIDMNKNKAPKTTIKQYIVNNCVSPKEIDDLNKLQRDGYWHMFLEHYKDKNRLIEDKKETNDNYVKDLFCHFERRILHETIAECIIRNYDKGDRQKNSLHSTDVSRLNFIYAKLDKKMKRIKWNNDPKGKEVCKLIVHPFLEFLIKEVNIFKKKQYDLFTDTGDMNFMKKVVECNNLLNYLDPCKDYKRGDNLINKIMSLISSHFDICKIDKDKILTLDN